MKSQMLKIFEVVAFSFLSCSAWADRSVSISVPEGKLQLTNPSAAAVTYSVECYDKVSGTNIITGHSSASLAAKKAVTVVSAGACAASAAPAKALTQGPFFCSGSVTYAQAPNLCGADSHMCSISDLSSAAVNGADFLSSYWLKNTSGTVWYVTYDTWGKSYPRDTSLTKGKGNAPITQQGKGTAYQCSDNNGGTGATLTYCTNSGTTSNNSGTVCCPNNNGFVSCKVTIHGTGAGAGHLQSPQFKGGAPF